MIYLLSEQNCISLTKVKIKIEAKKTNKAHLYEIYTSLQNTTRRKPLLVHITNSTIKCFKTVVLDVPTAVAILRSTSFKFS